MDDRIVNAILASAGVEKNKATEYFRGLIPEMRKLHSSYQSGNVVASYEAEATQACYLLRYFPVYSRLLPLVLLKSGGIENLLAKEATLSFFGCGPAPELYGLLRVLASKAALAKVAPAFSVNLVDKEHKHWNFARKITLSKLIPTVWPHPLTYTLIKIVNDKHWAEVGLIQTILESSDLFVFQNCLNEVDPEGYDKVKANIKRIKEAMKPGALLVIIDRAGYSQVTELIRWVRELDADGELECLLGQDASFTYEASAVHAGLSSIISDAKLLIDRNGTFSPFTPEENGLILQRKISYHAVVMRKI